jgi:hypothetical protein
MMNFFILNEDQEETARTLHDDDHAAVQGRLMDAADPGVGVNNNPRAEGYAVGAEVALQGNYILPQRIEHDQDYQKHCPDLISYLVTLPVCQLDPDVLFAPPPELQAQ